MFYTRLSRVAIHFFTVIALVMAMFVLSDSAAAATKTWDGGGGVDTNMSTAANWDSDTLPSPGDLLNFDGTSSNDANWDTSFPNSDDWELYLTSGYSGTLYIVSSSVTVASTTVLGGTVDVQTNTYIQNGSRIWVNGGEFTAEPNDGIIDINGDFTIISGTFGPAASTTVTGDWTWTGGTLDDSGVTWSLEFDGAADQAFATGGKTYEDLIVNNSGGGTSDDITGSGTFRNDGDVRIEQGDLALATFYMGGDLILADHAEAEFEWLSGSSSIDGDFIQNRESTFTRTSSNPLTFSGTGNQVVSSTASFGSTTINKSAGSLIPGSSVGQMTTWTVGILTVTNGSLDLATNDIGVRGAVLGLQNDSRVSLGTKPMLLSGNLTQSGTASLNTGSAGRIVWDSSGDETISVSGYGGFFGDVELSKTSGKVQFSISTGGHSFGSAYISTGNTWDMTAGTSTVVGLIENLGTITEDADGYIISTSTAAVTNSGGTTITEYSYSTSDTAYFSVTDYDENIDGTAQDTITVTITTDNGDSETVTLTETGVATSVFTGSIPVAGGASPTTSDSTLQLSGTEDVTISYTDGQDSTDTSSGVASFSGATATGGGASNVQGAKVFPKNASVLINDGAEKTNSREVVLDLGVDSAVEMLVSEEETFTGTTWQAYATQLQFLLSEGVGEKIVYVRYANGSGNLSETVSASIVFDPDSAEDTTPPMDEVPQQGDSAGSPVTDTDGDGLSDEEELLWKTDPEVADSDGDGYADGLEVKSGYNPLGGGKLIGPLDSPGSLVKNVSGFAVYFIGEDGKRHAFPNEQVFHTWFPDFNSVHTVTDEALAGVPLGAPMTVRPGTKLVKITTDPRVYAVGTGGVLQWIRTEDVARALYGPDWAARVIDVSDAMFVTYERGADIGTYLYPNGSVVTQSGDLYFVEGGMWRIFKGDQVAIDNGVVAQYSDQAPEGVFGLLSEPITGYEFSVRFPLDFE